VTCCARVSELGEDRFTMEYAIFTADGALSAHGSGRIVMLDYGTGQKAPVPDAVRAAIESL
jgi:acyl-CoA thioesterase FadM